MSLAIALPRLFFSSALVAIGVAGSPTGPTAAHAQAARADSAALIANALRAAPASVARNATVVDLQQNVLRRGTSEWVCMPDDPARAGDSPIPPPQPAPATALHGVYGGSVGVVAGR